jgi:hypothetical protein
VVLLLHERPPMVLSPGIVEHDPIGSNRKTIAPGRRRRPGFFKGLSDTRPHSRGADRPRFA